MLLKLAAARVLAHPRPWILRYLVSFIPASLFAAAITLPIWQSFPYPVIRSLLDQRDIDILLDTLMHIQDGNSNLWLPLLVAIVACLAWVPVQLTALWLEGGTLFCYTSEKPIPWKGFLYACNRWFGFMLLFQGIGIFVFSVILITTAGISIAARALWYPLMWLVIFCGLMLILLLSLWFETTRAVAVTRNEKHLGRALHHSARLVVQGSIALPAFELGAVACMAALLLFRRWTVAIIPGSWWLLSLVVSQVLLLTRHGLRLFRRGGEVIFAQIYAVDTTSSSSGIS